MTSTADGPARDDDPASRTEGITIAAYFDAVTCAPRNHPVRRDRGSTSSDVSMRKSVPNRGCCAAWSGMSTEAVGSRGRCWSSSSSPPSSPPPLPVLSSLYLNPPWSAVVMMTDRRSAPFGDVDRAEGEDSALKGLAATATALLVTSRAEGRRASAKGGKPTPCCGEGR